MSSASRIRVMVVDDHPIMRNGLRVVLEASGHFEVVGQAANGEEAVTTAVSLEPEVVLMDVMMPRKNGVDACREIVELLPGTRVLMVTAASEMDAVIESFAAGAAGYVQKYSDPDELVETVLDVTKGRLRLPESAVSEVFAMLRGKRTLATEQAENQLSAAELNTLTLFTSGKSYVQVAEEIGKTTATVRNTLYRVQAKLGIRTKQQLVIWAVRNGLLDDVVLGVDPQSTPEM